MNKNVNFYGEKSYVSYGDYHIHNNAVIISNVDTMHFIFTDDSQTFKRPEYFLENMDTLIINGHMFERVKKNV